MPKQKRTQSRPKALYRVKNWSEYDKALVNRGSVTFWMTGDFVMTWRHTGEKQRGGQFDYSDQAILLMLTKRSKNMQVSLPKKAKQKLNIVMDSTGLKVYGEGEWQVRQRKVYSNRSNKRLKSLQPMELTTTGKCTIA